MREDREHTGNLRICIAAMGCALGVGLGIGAFLSLPMLVLGHAGLYVSLSVLMFAVVIGAARSHA
jgi:hypothetical protein